MTILRIEFPFISYSYLSLFIKNVTGCFFNQKTSQFFFCLTELFVNLKLSPSFENLIFPKEITLKELLHSVQFLNEMVVLWRAFISNNFLPLLRKIYSTGVNFVISPPPAPSLKILVPFHDASLELWGLDFDSEVTDLRRRRYK